MSLNSNPTANPQALTGDACIQLSFDQTTQRLRVDTGATINITTGAMEVAIDATEDSIQIGDGNGHFLAVNADGSINVTSSPGAGSATAANQVIGNASLSSIDSKLTSPLSVTGTFWQATQPVSAASLPLPSGASTSALQSSIISALGSPFQAGGSIGNTSFIATQATGTNLHTVVDSGIVSATQSGTWNINNISGTISLPTGAATETTLSGVRTDKFAATATLFTIARSNVSQTAIASNSSRKGFILWNDSGAVCYISFSAAATTAAFTVRLSANSGYEPSDSVVYTGVMSVIWGTGGAGNLLATELT